MVSFLYSFLDEWRTAHGSPGVKRIPKPIDISNISRHPPSGMSSKSHLHIKQQQISVTTVQRLPHPPKPKRILLHGRNRNITHYPQLSTT